MTEQKQSKTETTQEGRSGFEVQLGTFSGPLDLLCHLVECREMDPTKLKLTELISQYVQFLLNSKRTTLNEMAEFFSFASRLLLRKVHLLFPSQEEDGIGQEPADEEYIIDADEEELSVMLEKFRPYRNAAARLAQFQQERERSFIRIADEDSAPFYDIGDLYGLSSLWWEILARYNDREREDDYSDESLWDEIPDAIPEERQVEQRMDELLQQIRGRSSDLGTLLVEKNRKNLIVTLLALLEMSRLGMVHILQSETLGAVFIDAS